MFPTLMRRLAHRIGSRTRKQTLGTVMAAIEKDIENSQSQDRNVAEQKRREAVYESGVRTSECG